jgi:hypothetical protein
MNAFQQTMNSECHTSNKLNPFRMCQKAYLHAPRHERNQKGVNSSSS